MVKKKSNKTIEKEKDIVDTKENIENSNVKETEENESDIDSSEAFEKKITELNDKYLRIYSEFDNYRKRTINEKIELTKTASSDMAESLLPAIDDLERAIKSNEDTKDIEAVKEGMLLIYNKFIKVLGEKGVKEMKCIGKEFDADFHDALTNIPAKSKKEKGKIVDVIEKGYYISGKVLRYAKVIVGS